MEDLKKMIREVPDFPKPGILFYDITTLLKDKTGFRAVIDGLRHHYQDAEVDVVLGIEARGFIFAPALAYAWGRDSFRFASRKSCPPNASASLTNSSTAPTAGDAQGRGGNGSRVLIVDDLLATGGTAAATARMVREAGGMVAGMGFVIELKFLNGRQKLGG